MKTGKCENKVGIIGSNCQTEVNKAPCIIENSECVEGICRCAPFYEQNAEECILMDQSK